MAAIGSTTPPTRWRPRARSIRPLRRAGPQEPRHRGGGLDGFGHSRGADRLLAFQRDFGRAPPGAVLDGRDIGTVIFPDAEVKILVTAAAPERARRRARELQAAGGQGQRGRDPRRYPAPGRARQPAFGRAPASRPGCALARHHAFGYRRGIPGRRRYRRSRPSRPEARLTALPSWRVKPAPPASLLADLRGPTGSEPSFRSRVYAPGPPFDGGAESRQDLSRRDLKVVCGFRRARSGRSSTQIRRRPLSGSIHGHCCRHCRADARGFRRAAR